MFWQIRVAAERALPSGLVREVCYWFVVRLCSRLLLNGLVGKLWWSSSEICHMLSAKQGWSALSDACAL
jgi:hypothetical protein